MGSRNDRMNIQGLFGNNWVIYVNTEVRLNKGCRLTFTIDADEGISYLRALFNCMG